LKVAAGPWITSTLSSLLSMDCPVSVDKPGLSQQTRFNFGNRFEGPWLRGEEFIYPDQSERPTDNSRIIRYL
jgi:hypothetical protein